MVKLLKKLFSVALLAGLVGVVAYAMVKPDPKPTQQGGGGGGRRAGPPVGADGEGPRVPVLATHAARQNVPVLIDAVGTVRAWSSVTIRPQVDGRILRMVFQEGQDVKAGDLIAEIDPATYQAALDQAVARRAVTETQLANARRDYDRMAKIPSVMAQKTMDTQEAQVAQFEAQLKADDAAVSSARTVLGYTRIVSPLSGRTGLRLVDEGNLVRAGDAGLVSISEIDPIAVHFTLPQQRLREVQRALERGRVEVQALESDGRAVTASGELQVIDNQIDAQTGTIRMKARFANSKRELWPGQFVNVRVKIDVLDNVIAVPTAAVQRGPAGAFVWLVGAEGKAVVRAIETGLMTETLVVVKSGLDGGEQIVTTGFARISEGARLFVRDAPVTTPVGIAPPGAQARPRGKGEGRTGEARGGEGRPSESRGGESRGGDGEKGRRRRETDGGGAATSERVQPGAATAATPGQRPAATP